MSPTRSRVNYIAEGTCHQWAEMMSPACTTNYRLCGSIICSVDRVDEVLHMYSKSVKELHGI